MYGLKIVIFGLCFLIGLSIQRPFAEDDNPTVLEANTLSSDQKKSVAELPKCGVVRLKASEVEELTKLKRRYNSLKEKQKRLVERYPGQPYVTETERYANLEWKMEELRRIYKERFSEESRVILRDKPCLKD